ncbi:hypothetical protein CDV55_100582 [Aspergillus turcosus]|nr:hypothetical protein CDV55_100582 [Aspergillus turcosus]
MLEEHRIQEGCVKFGTTEDQEACSLYQDKSGCLSYNTSFIGIPLKSVNVNVTDPRTIVINALLQLDNLQSNILAAQLQMILGSWPGYSDDIVQSISLSVELLMQTVSSMQTVVEIGKEQQDLDKKKLVDEILMAVFLVVPFLGEIDIISDAFADLARIMTLVGDVSVAGYTVYAIADHPDEVLPIIFETLLLAGQRTPDEFGTMAASRRKITDKTISSLGSVFEHQNTVIHNMVQDCVRD